MKPRMVSFSRDTEVGASVLDSRGCTESAGGACPAMVSGWNEVMVSGRVEVAGSAGIQGRPDRIEG